ncbi:acetyl-CoA carboxylase biotin carboxyl carrier protein subunit [Desertibacillus haloalkaliphilus]|uniref:acetyl-CoA carboxylase biotin carboxyl carrier protein subunit n=1 Tax=Desertibacillus haloalkaliphilus TaxID=1328930 RepID=UPI0028A6DE9C|nr:acetyl-CoA carboxylase biotin carboxyl carrier protein subunit [Desertibacillus haloalkaliphilus]
MKTISTNMAGNVWKINVAVGEEVDEGQEVIILESMKMEIPIEAQEGGTITSILINEGDFVDEGEAIIELE